MNKTDNARKTLKVLGILTIIAGVLGLLAATGIFAGGAMLFGDAANSGALAAADQQSVLVATGGFTVLGIMSLVGAIVDLLLGIFSVRASNDFSKVQPAWVLSIIGLILAVIGVVVNLSSGINYTSIASSVTVAFDAADLTGVAGSIAGDDTVFIMCYTDEDAERIAEMVKGLQRA